MESAWSSLDDGLSLDEPLNITGAEAKAPPGQFHFI